MRISIEGLIGCGKSTALTYLSQWWTTYQEPVEDWQALLEAFYTDTPRWALAMNLQALLSICVTPASDERNRPVVVERSPLSCKEVFARMNLNDDSMNSDEWQLYCDLYAEVGWSPDVIVYLKSNPNVCLERTRIRDRPSERNISKAYLNKLQFAHHTMLKYYSGEVHVVDANQPSPLLCARLRDILESYHSTQTFS